MELSRQEYPALLTSLQPTEAIAVLNDRVNFINRTHIDIADWLAERRKLEDAYVQGLRGLAAKKIEGAANLGVFQPPWQSILAACESLADAHKAFSHKVETDVERPLRNYATDSREMQGLTTIQGNLASLAKDFDKAQRETTKLQGKRGRTDSGKMSKALSGAQEAFQQWESQAPYVFEQLQALDENRVNHLRDVLTQLQTHEVDTLERSRGLAEAALNALLNVDTSDEISSFVARTSSGLPTLNSPRRQSRPSTSNAGAQSASLSTPVPPLPDASPSLAPPATSMDDRRSDVSSVSGAAQVPATPSPEKTKKGGLGGLRRLGTVMTRRNEKGPSPDKRARQSRNPLKRGHSSKIMRQIPSPKGSMTELADTSARQRSTTDAAEQTPQAAAVSTQQEAPSGLNGDAPSPSRPSGDHLTNGLQSDQVPDRVIASPTTLSESDNTPRNIGDVSAATLSAIDRAQEEAAAESEQPSFKLNIKNEPIREEDGEAQKALSEVANTLRAQALPPPRRTGTARGRREVRNTMFVPGPTPPPVATTAAGTSASELLPAPNAVASDSGSTGGGSPGPSSNPFAAAAAATTIAASAPGDAPPAPEEQQQQQPQQRERAMDAQSIRSSHSLASLASGAVRHPEMHGPGLNASVVETVSASFENGSVTRAVVIGEIAVVKNPDSNSNAGTTVPLERIRLDNFSVLLKVAPNPTFVSQVSGANPGEYTLDTSHISGSNSGMGGFSSSNSRAQVAFKYQVHMDSSNLASYAPMILKPTWKIEASQASVMIEYSFNPLFAIDKKKGSSYDGGGSGGGGVLLQNLVIVVNVSGAGGSAGFKTTGCQSKPVGAFSKERGLIYWKLGEVRLESGSAAGSQRLLARFATEGGEAKPGNIEARWEVGGEDGLRCGSGLGIGRIEAGEGAGEGAEDGGAGGGGKGCTTVRRLISGKYVA